MRPAIQKTCNYSRLLGSVVNISGSRVALCLPAKTPDLKLETVNLLFEITVIGMNPKLEQSAPLHVLSKLRLCPKAWRSRVQT
jgi:hypothetical protein